MKLLRKLLTGLLCASMIFSSFSDVINPDHAEAAEEEEVGYLATFIAKYEYNMGVEYAQYPSGKYTDTYRTDVLYYALRKNGETRYIPLNNDRPLFYPANRRQLGSPSLFRKTDGSYGLIAAVNNTTDQIFISDSEDLLYFHNERTVRLNNQGIIVKNPKVIFNEGIQMYEIYWEGGDGKSYVTETEDFVTFSTQVETSYQKEEVTAELPVYAVTEEANEFAVTEDEYDRIMKKYGEIHSVATNIKNQKVDIGEAITLPDMVEVEYNDGSTANKSVEWDLDGLGLDLNNPAKGIYKIPGTVKNTTYNVPVANYRADPCIVFNEEDEMYYMTGSFMELSPGRAYQSLAIRKAKTMNELFDAEEVIVWTSGNTADGNVTGWYWAPELHYIAGKWKIIAMGSVSGNSRQCIFTCDGDDMMEPSNWRYEGYIKQTTNNQWLGNFDTTYFEYEGVCYYVSPAGSRIYITTVDPEDLTKPTGPRVQISRPDRAFEYNIGPGEQLFGNDGQDVQEGSAVLIHDGRIFVAYAGSTIDMFYCVGLLYADLEDDLMDPDSWHKYPYPLLSTTDLTTTLKDTVLEDQAGRYTGVFGPGHNSFTIDEDGNPVIVYHARAWEDSYDSDVVMFGIPDSEEKPSHNSDITGSELEINTAFGLPRFSTRRVKAGSSISYDMEIVDEEGRFSYLIWKQAKADNGQTIKISADDTVLKTETLNNTGNDASYTKTVRIPNQVLRNARTNAEGKKFIRVKLESNRAGEDSARILRGFSITTTLFEGSVGNDKYGLVDPGRHAYANSVHFGADGFPIFNMTPEQILDPSLASVTLQVTVGDVQEPNPTVLPTPTTPVVAVESIRLGKSSHKMDMKKKVTLSYYIQPANATNKNVTWTSSNTSVANVKNGIVHAKKPGEATITVTTLDGAKTDRCKITVRKPRIKLNTSTLKLKVRKSTSKVRIKSSTPTGEKIKSASIKRKKIAKISVKSGKLRITARRRGTTKITITSTNGGKKTFRLRVVE